MHEAEMLLLCLHFPRLPAEALGLNDRFDAVTDQRGASRWLITAAPAARIGTPLGTALSLQPQLRAYARSSKAEHAALLQLAHWIRSEEHTSELQSLMRISYAVFCLKKKSYEKQKKREHKHNP